MTFGHRLNHRRHHHQDPWAYCMWLLHNCLSHVMWSACWMSNWVQSQMLSSHSLFGIIFFPVPSIVLNTGTRFFIFQSSSIRHMWLKRLVFFSVTFVREEVFFDVQHFPDCYTVFGIFAAYLFPIVSHSNTFQKPVFLSGAFFDFQVSKA